MVLVNVLQESRPILADIANRAWGDGDTDLFSTARMVFAVLRESESNPVGVQLSWVAARMLRDATPRKTLLYESLEKDIVEAQQDAVRSTERRDRKSVRESRDFRFLC